MKLTNSRLRIVFLLVQMTLTTKRIKDKLTYLRLMFIRKHQKTYIAQKMKFLIKYFTVRDCSDKTRKRLQI